jgi:hypothetical protein
MGSPPFLRLLFLLAGIFPCGLVSAQAEFWENLGPLYHRFPLTLDPGRRTEIAGPLLSYELRGETWGWTVSPLISYRNDPLTDWTEIDLAYPVITYDRFGAEFRFHIFQLFSFSGGQTMEEEEKRRFTLFPFYFQQRSEDPELNYTALFPIYGTIKNRFLRDEIYFALFPLYARTTRRDVVTWNYLYPMFHWRRGDGLRGWQVWPLTGHEVKEITYRENPFTDELDLIPGHERLFALWPIFFSNRLGIGSENPQTQRLLLPLYSFQRSPLRDTSSVPWPLGFTWTHDREHGYREWGAPWPFIVFSRGENRRINRIWPLFSQARTDTHQNEFYLWPVYQVRRVQSEPLDRRRTRVLFFLYSDLIERNTETQTALERTDLWPLFTARRDHQGNERLQILALLEPLLPHNKSIERTYSPVWSLWRSEKNALSGAASRSLLWNLYRRDITPDTRKTSLLFGLFQYESGPDGRRWRLFYIPFGRKPTPPLEAEQEWTNGRSVDEFGSGLPREQRSAAVLNGERIAPAEAPRDWTGNRKREIKRSGKFPHRGN